MLELSQWRAPTPSYPRRAVRPRPAPTTPGPCSFPGLMGSRTFALTDTSGDPYNIAASTTPAHCVLVYFGYTHCPDLCPLNMATAAATIREMPAPDRAPRQRHLCLDRPRQRHAHRDQDVARSFRRATSSGLAGRSPRFSKPRLLPAFLCPSPNMRAQLAPATRSVHAGYILVYTQDNRAHLEFPAEITVTQESHDLDNLLQHGWQT